MGIRNSTALGAYAGVLTLGAVWLGLAGASQPTTTFGTIDVKRINVRENDGTLRMIIAGSDNIGGLVKGDVEYPHPNRTEAGMIFLNDEGIENGGLVFDGKMVDGKPTNGGHLSFDRYLQDQTLYIQSIENGPRRRAGLFVQDRPDGQVDIAALIAAANMPRGPEQEAAVAAAGADHRLHRAFLGRDWDDSSKLVLRDGQGRPRLQLNVAKDGAASIEFLDESGQVARTIGADTIGTR